MPKINFQNDGVKGVSHETAPPTSARRRIVFLSAARASWGAEQSMFTLAREAKAIGYDVELVCFPGTIDSDWQAAVGRPAYTVSVPAPEHESHESKARENMLLWAEYLRRSQPHDRVVLFTYYLSVASLALRALLLFRGIRTVLDLHDNLPGEKGRILLRTACLGLDGVVACSEFTAAQLSGKRIPTVGIHGPAEPLFPVAAERGGARRVLVAGRIIAEKRHDIVVKAVSTLDDGTVLVLRGAGDGSVHDNSTSVRRHATELLQERFVDDGKVPAERVLDGIDVLVVANNTEPMGRTVLEAQLSGIPVVVPDEGGSAELVDDGVTGLVFASGDAADLARVLQRLADDPDLAAAIVTRAKVHAGATVTPVHYARKYLKVLAG